MSLSPRSRRLIAIGIIAFVAAALLTIVIDRSRADAAPPPNPQPPSAQRVGGMTPGVHRVKVTKNRYVTFRVNKRGFRVRGASHARAVQLIRQRQAKFKKRLCVDFGYESPHQRVPTINLFCNKHARAVVNNLAECGGQAAVAGTAAALVGPIGAEVAAVAAFAGCEFSKTMAYFQRQQTCRKGTSCAVRIR